MVSKQKMAEYKKKSRDKARSKGLCIFCYKNKSKPTSTACLSCAKKSVERRNKAVKKAGENGICTICLKAKPKKGRRICGVCVERKRLKGDDKIKKVCKKHGISFDDYKQMKADQNNLCAICGNPPDGRWGRLNIDHCHKTGKVRGLLCVNCNLGIGNLQDCITNLLRAIKYLKKHQ